MKRSEEDTASSSTCSSTAVGADPSTSEQNQSNQPKNDPSSYWYEPPPTLTPPQGAQHGKGGVFYGGNWADIEDLADTFNIDPQKCSGCKHNNKGTPCPRSQSRNVNNTQSTYDVVVIGAGCIGGAVARELSKYQCDVLWLEAADDVSQGATKGNSGIVHAGFDDKPGTNRAKYCWKGNQMFAQLDRELRFGYQKNGSLVVAFNEQDMKELEDLKKRGETNGVKFLRIVGQRELRKMEPHISPNAIGALYASEAGNVIPYEYAVALAENAVDNGVQLKIRREVQSIESVDDDHRWKLTVRHWEPEEYVKAKKREEKPQHMGVLLMVSALAIAGLFWLFVTSLPIPQTIKLSGASTLGAIMGSAAVFFSVTRNTQIDYSDIQTLVDRAGRAVGLGGIAVELGDMLLGGSGSSRIHKGVTFETEIVHAKYVINCAGGASDQIARMVGDNSFKIKPRIGDYILLNRNQGHLAKHTLFPCPDPVLGKGVLVQTTLWSNLILGPTARDMHNKDVSAMGPKEIQQYILSHCKKLVDKFDPKETIHTFCGARAKSDRGDWIIEASAANSRMIHVAGIDSPGLAGSPAIATEAIRLLKESGFEAPPNLDFNPNRAPIIIPKAGMKGLKFGPVGKNDSDGTDEAKMAANVICKCERVTELEVVRALRRSLPIDSSQGIRKRTRAGMGHCQGDPENYSCEARVKAIIARETHMAHVGGRPWPATSILKQRWIDDAEKSELAAAKDTRSA